MRIAIAFAGMALALASHSVAGQEPIVQLKDDPSRRVVIENALVRVWEVRVPVGEWTPFHEHRHDQVTVRINSTVLTSVPKGGGLFSFTRDFQLESGSVSYADYTGSPYVHKITPKGPNSHHVIETELLGPRPSAAQVAPSDRAGATIVLDNQRIRVARLVVEPGRSAEIAPRPNVFVVVVKGAAGDLKPASVRWYGDAGARTIRNDGPLPLELVEVEVKT
jgi:hypothetical protein